MGISLTWLLALQNGSYKHFFKSNPTFTPLDFELTLYKIVLCPKVINLTVITLQLLPEARSLLTRPIVWARSMTTSEILTLASSKRFFTESKTSSLVSLFFMEYIQYRNKGVSHTAPILYYLPDYQD